MKRHSSAVLALLATLLFAVPTESQAFFGFFGGGFSFGFGGGSGWHGWGPGYWHRPWYHRYWGYPRYRYRYRPYGYYPYRRWFAPYYQPYLPGPPAATVPETKSEK